MKITNIKTEDYTFHVTLEPNWLERLFGIKARVEKYREGDTMYMFGGGRAYIKEDGTKTHNGSYVGEAIDRWRRKF